MKFSPGILAGLSNKSSWTYILIEQNKLVGPPLSVLPQV